MTPEAIIRVILRLQRSGSFAQLSLAKASNFIRLLVCSDSAICDLETSFFQKVLHGIDRTARRVRLTRTTLSKMVFSFSSATPIVVLGGRRLQLPRKKDGRKKYAAAWERFNFPSHMDKVKKYDVIFMYAKGVGFIAVGQACGPVKKLEPQQSGRLRTTWPEREWRIKMEGWFAWLPDEDVIRWPSKTLYRNKTFFDITADAHEDVRIAISKAFLQIGSPVNV